MARMNNTTVRPTLAPAKSFKRGVPMPTGVSANSIGLDGRVSNIRRLLMLGLPLTVLLVLVLGIWLLVQQNLTVFSTKNLTNGTYSYTFSFYKKAEPVNLNQGEGLQYGNHATVIAAPTTDEITNDCSLVAGGQWKTAFTAIVAGSSRPVCSRDNTSYFVTFNYGQARHLFEITYTNTKDAKLSDVRTIIESLTVSLD
ncbi:MAG TPA: hypothetical protein VMR45_02535 [Patescibacteria group bacterium]|nr:hypothetical protein [Patescibacteria group bacterium]